MDRLIRKIKNKHELTKVALKLQCLKETQRIRKLIIHRINRGLVTVLRKALRMASHRNCSSDIIRKTVVGNPRKVYPFTAQGEWDPMRQQEREYLRDGNMFFRLPEVS